MSTTPLTPRRRAWTATLGAVALLLAPALAACGAGGGAAAPTGGASTGTGAASSGPASPSGAPPGGTTSGGPSVRTPSGTAPTSTRPPAAATTVSVYFLRGGRLAPAHRTVLLPGTAGGAVRALLAGPAATEARAGLTSAVPAGTALRGISVHAAVATVDLSGRYAAGTDPAATRARLAQVVFTATQFGTVHQVLFRLEGRPVGALGGTGLARPLGRADFEDQAPAVLIESPAVLDTVGSPLRVQGSADTFEAVFRLTLTDSTGHAVADVQVQATSGTGTRGRFATTLAYRTTAPTGRGTLTAYVLSQDDGHRVTVAAVPVTVIRTG